MTASGVLWRAASALVGIALLVGMASCGSSEPKKQIDASTFMPQLISTMRAQGSADIDFTFEAGSESFAGDGVMVFRDDGESDGRLLMTADAIEFEMVVVDGRLWLAYDELTAGQYFEVDVRHGNPTEREFAEVVDQMDPLRSFEPFAEAIESVEVLGKPRSFDGVVTRRHRVVVDTAVINGLPELDALPREEVPPYFVYEMYVGTDGLLRHISYGLGHVEMTASYSHFGSKERIDPPSRDEITLENPFAGLDQGI